MFNGNEASYLRWKEVFDLLGIGAKGRGGSIETQVLGVMDSDGFVKLRALAELCSREFFDDASLSVVTWRRILEVSDVEKRGGETNEKEEGGARKLEILDACFALGDACNHVEDWDDAERYYIRAEGYEKLLGRDSEKALEATHSLICATEDDGRRIETFKDLVKRMEMALGEERFITLDTLNDLGAELMDNGQYEEAKEVHERYLAGRIKVLGEDHKDTFDSLTCLRVVYDDLGNYEKASEYYERALKGYERSLGKNHPDTLGTVMDIAILYHDRLEDYGKAVELYESARGT